MPEATGFYLYFAVFGTLLAAGLGLPIPEEIPVVLGGAAAGHAANQHPPGHPHWYILLPICILGVVLGDGFLYTIGRFGGRKLLQIGWVKRHVITPEKRAKIESNFHEYGIKILLGARLLPGIRSPIFIMAGVLKMPLHRFILADGLYAIPGVSLLFFLAYAFTDQFVEMVDQFEHGVALVKPILIVVAILGVAGFLLYEYYRRSMVTGVTGDPQEVPLIGQQIITPDPNADALLPGSLPTAHPPANAAGHADATPSEPTDGAGQPQGIA